MRHKTPALAADAVLFDEQGRLLLVRRKNPPFQGWYALPGGFVEYGETVEHAVQRELREETGVKAKVKTLIGVYSDPRRDPRGHTVSIAYLMHAHRVQPKAGDDAAAAAFVADWRRQRLAFDHRQIVADAVKLMKAEK